MDTDTLDGDKDMRPVFGGDLRMPLVVGWKTGVSASLTRFAESLRAFLNGDGGGLLAGLDKLAVACSVDFSTAASWVGCSVGSGRRGLELVDTGTCTSNGDCDSDFAGVCGLAGCLAAEPAPNVGPFCCAFFGDRIATSTLSDASCSSDLAVSVAVALVATRVALTDLARRIGFALRPARLGSPIASLGAARAAAVVVVVVVVVDFGRRFSWSKSCSWNRTLFLIGALARMGRAGPAGGSFGGAAA